MATAPPDSPVLTADLAIAVIDPKSYAERDSLFDIFEMLCDENDELHDPFRFITRYEDVKPR